MDLFKNMTYTVYILKFCVKIKKKQKKVVEYNLLGLKHKR